MNDENPDVPLEGVRVVQDWGDLTFTHWNGRPYISAMGEEDGVIFDLLDFIAWVRENYPDLLEVAHE